MKKLLAVCIIGLCLGTTAVFASHPGGLGIGLQGGYGGGVGGGLSLKFPSLPIFWTIDASGDWLGVAGDYYFIDQSLSKTLNFGWYLGAGGFVSLGFWGNHTANFELGAGARGVIGLTIRPVNILEIYLQATPSLGIFVGDKIGIWPSWYGGGLGIRLWL
jgi:hypothetical protein